MALILRNLAHSRSCPEFGNLYISPPCRKEGHSEWECRQCCLWCYASCSCDCHNHGHGR